MANHLYYGDNLDILRSQIKDESIDLIYLDRDGHTHVPPSPRLPVVVGVGSVG